VSASICAIIPSYNRAAMLRECIDSVLAQTRPPDQIVVVNDGSTDDTEQVVRSYGDRITLITKANGGKSSALNLALAQCSADYIWICDDDDLAAPNGLECLVTALDAHPEAGFAFGDLRTFRDENGQRSYEAPGYRFRREETDLKVLFFEQMIACQFAMLVRRSLYDKTGPFREDLIRSQDYDMAIRLIQQADAVRVPDVIFFQRVHAGMRGSAADSFEAEKSVRKWLAYDQKFFMEILERYPLSAFTPSFARSWVDRALAERAALIERGAVFASHAMWPQAIKDFQQAAKSTAPLTEDERRIVETVIGFDMAWYILREHPDSVTALRSVYSSGLQGRELMLAVCRPLVWLARGCLDKGQWRQGLALLLLMANVLGWSGATHRLLRSLRS
jgi:glycosyltransferase involved in cell wall biosynthesis